MPDTAGVAGLAVAFAGGVISIATPCSWPLIPGYLAYVSGVSVGDLSAPGTSGTAGAQAAPVRARSGTRRVVGATALFVLGFAIVFTALGASASVVGTFLLKHLPLFIKIAGVFVILMGLATLGVLKVPGLYREKRFDLSKVRSGPAGAIPLGMAFAFGWSPCIGPILAAVMTLAAQTNTAAHGALLLFVYSLGMGIPFLLFALLYARAGRAFGAIRRHSRTIERVGGVLLVGIGLLLVSGAWTRLFTPLIRYFTLHRWLV